MGTVLLIDASPLIYAVANTPVGKFTTSFGEPTGIRFGVLRSIRSYTEQTRADKTVVCYDLPGPVVKAEGISSYKSNRTITPEKEAMWAQVPALKEMVGLTKYSQVEAAGYEADDVIGLIARKMASLGHEVLIVSPDNDMLQLTWHSRIKIWMPAQPKKGHPKPWYKDEEYTRENYGVTPKELLLWRAIDGDKSDNLPGVKLTPMESALTKDRLLDYSKALPKISFLGLKEFNAVIGSGYAPLTTKLRDSKDLVESNFGVMSLVDPPEVRIIKGRSDHEGLMGEFNRLEMNSLKKKITDYAGEPVDTEKLAP